MNWDNLNQLTRLKVKYIYKYLFRVGMCNIYQGADMLSLSFNISYTSKRCNPRILVDA